MFGNFYIHIGQNIKHFGKLMDDTVAVTTDDPYVNTMLSTTYPSGITTFLS